MEIILGKTAGFCYGVKNAINTTYNILKDNKEVYCLGELVHNKQVTTELQSNGLKIIDNIENAKNEVIIRAHGTIKEDYEFAEKNNIKVNDLTCPNVLKIHNIAKEYVNKGYFIFLVGQKEHPETIGTESFCGTDYCIIESLDDLNIAIQLFEKSNKRNSVVIVQTTFDLAKFNLICENLKEKIQNIIVENTICNATKLKQDETEKISKVVELMIIIGGKHSSNSTKLYELSKINCKNVLFIETSKDININEIKNYQKIGIMAGSSTPEQSIKEVIEILKQV